MSKTNKVFIDFIIYAFGSFGSKLIGFFLLPMYTRYLTREDYGRLDLINTVGQLVMPLLCMQIKTSVYRFLLTNEEDENKILASSFTFSIFISLFLLMVSFFIDGTKEYLVILLMYIFSFEEAMLNQVLRGKNKIKLFSLFGFFKTLIIMGLNIYFIVYKKYNFYHFGPFWAFLLERIK